ncbi:thermonuclease family protein [Solibacillus sp. FSL W7-1472]|uniref:thermonuclease family protein n=1 Tax=Solibacillus sp. FSL W7-1472 TaxID=2921707 RepID=UPI0030D7401C
MKKIIMALFFSALLISGCTEETNTATTNETNTIQGIAASSKETATKYDLSDFEEYELQDIIDGDTIRIKYNGSSEKVRLLLIDAPETNHETLGEQPFGPEAKEFLKQLLAGQDSVYVEFDVTYRDKYKRLLAYIYTKEGISVQEQLLKSGLVRVAYIYDPNTKHVDWFKSIQKTAQHNAIGIWSVKDYVTNRGYDKEVYYAAVNDENKSTVEEDRLSMSENDASCKIKGNINSKGNKIYHMPGQRDFENTVAEEMFCSEKDAKDAGFVPAKQ